MIPGIRGKCYGFDLLWQEHREAYFQSIRDELATKPKLKRREYLQKLLDNNIIVIENQYRGHR